MKKKIYLLAILILAIGGLKSQNYLIGFTGSGESTTVDSVEIENLSRGGKIKISGITQLSLQKTSTAIPSYPFDRDFRIYPNPMHGNCKVEYVNFSPGNAVFEIYDLAGKKVGIFSFHLITGRNVFTVNGLKSGLYTVRIISQGNSHSGKLLSLGSDRSEIGVTHDGAAVDESVVRKSGEVLAEGVMEYRDGELLKFTGYSGNHRTIVVEKPTQSKTIDFRFIPCVDADNNHYPIVRIGSKYWMAENLKTTRYSNGDPIAPITDGNQWISAVSGAFCNYNNSLTNAPTYGRLYNWFAVTDKRGIAPAGWRVPAYEESVAMAVSLVGDKPVGGKLKETGTRHWFSPNSGAGNSSGFTGRPGGIRFTDGAFYSLGYYGYWWCPSPNDSVYSYAFGLRHISDSLDFYVGVKTYGMSLRCVKDAETNRLANMEISQMQEVVAFTVPVTGGSLVVPQKGTPVDGLKISVPAHSFTADQTFRIAYAQIQNHDFGKFFNPVSPLIKVAYGGGYADGLMTVEVPVEISAGHFAMGFLYNEATGELEGMPLVSVKQNSVTIATRHFATSRISGSGLKAALKHGNIFQAVTDSGYFVISSIALNELKNQTDIVSDFEPGYDDWEFVNKGSFVSPNGICSGMTLSAMWYYVEERREGNTQLFHKYDKYTIANYNQLWQDNTQGIKLASMVHKDYSDHNKVYEDAIDLLAEDKTKDSLSWYAFAYSILQTKQPQFIGIISSTGGGHALIANDVWMKDGKLWISDPNHPGVRTLNIHYSGNEFEPYFAALDANANPKNFEYIAYYGKTAVVDWSLVTQRWQELEEGTIGAGTFPEVKLLVADPTFATQGWDLNDEFKTSLDTLHLFVRNNDHGNYAFTVFDAEGYQIVPADQGYIMSYNGKVGLKPGLNIIGYCLYHRTYNQQNMEVWDWADFKWIDIYKSTLKISPDPIVSGRLNREITLTAMHEGMSPADMKYVWNFGDGTTEVTVNDDNKVKHVFSKAGKFTVTVKQFNRISGELIGTASAAASIGYNNFSISLSSNVITTCVRTNGTDFTQGNSMGYELNLNPKNFDKVPSATQSGNIVNFNWDGIYTWTINGLKFQRKGSATFTFNSSYDTLTFTLSDDMPSLPVQFQYNKRKFSITGKVPLIRETADYISFGVSEAYRTQVSFTIKEEIAYPDGTKCEAVNFSENYKINLFINLY